MKLLYRIFSRLSLFLIVIMGIWAYFFYTTIMEEINDEVDDSLEDYSETIIIRALAGEQLPHEDIGSNNQYFLTEISTEYARSVPHIRYKDSMVYIVQKRETEPARILSTIFRDREGQYYELTVSTPTIEKEDLMEAILYWMIFLFISLLLVIILVNIWVYYRNTRPLYVVLKWLKGYKVGSPDNPELHNPTDITEFKQLNQTAVESMQRAEQSFQKQKQFISNASHEIQTPLAVSLNRIELLMEDEHLSEQQLNELAKTQSTLEYITRLNKSLLLLSKIDNRQFPETGEVEINALLRRFIPDYEEVYRYKDIRLKLAEKGILRLHMNDSLASILINNLLKNSYVHNIPGGEIQIEVSDDRVLFMNEGEAPALDPELIFERFHQGSKKEGSTGLGLAIAKSICEVGGLTIRYFYRDKKHCFEIYDRSKG